MPLFFIIRPIIYLEKITLKYCEHAQSGTPNIVNNLGLLLSDPNSSPDTSCAYGSNCLAGFYWSSTEYSYNPTNVAWYQYFASSGSSQNYDRKYVAYGVRCSRALTI